MPSLLTPELIDFIREHEDEAVDRLLLSARRFPGVPLPFVAEQILARRQAKEKLPTWYANRRIVFPSRVAVEQASSEVAAGYKRRLFAGDSLCDLTGGLGVDASAFAGVARQVVYADRDPACCQAAEENFKTLGLTNISVCQGDAGEVLAGVRADTLYVDPSRRPGGDKRVFALADCAPDVLQLKPLLLERAPRLVVKCSPMVDITEGLALLPECEEVHILAVRNECKELLFTLGRVYRPGNAAIRAVNVTASGEEQSLAFFPGEEREAAPREAARVEGFLYEPHAAIMKAGAFKVVATRFDLCKLHPRSHLYTADRRLEGFPGKMFAVDDVIPFSGKALTALARSCPRANITTRNFTLSVAELRRKSGIADGGDAHIFATTLSGKGALLVVCHRVE
ncbi:MAG: class I SAM-dependent methyltransferase [Odoribacteraceae bacterium]|jgi:hypothetical protein|nr:class I SAM-dependent methyltransferase [Odoribacteraceae bacterium]